MAPPRLKLHGQQAPPPGSQAGLTLASAGWASAYIIDAPAPGGFVVNVYPSSLSHP